MQQRKLVDWLRWQETLNPRTIDLGLGRVRAVAARMKLPGFSCPVVTIGGTNGKGSCVAYLESCLHAAGYRVASYTSPHLHRYNERIRVGGVEVSDEALCQAFAVVEAARGATALTYFEFGTLAALHIFHMAQPDAVLLEVGLGGRLDAVNLVDSDIALVASIGTDHADWLGASREQIGCEKAGIFRPGKPAVCGDPDPPVSLLQQAATIGARLHVAGRDFHPLPGADGRSWDWQGWSQRLEQLPLPGLEGSMQLQNAAAAVAVLELLRPRLPLPPAALAAGLATARLAARCEILPGPPEIVLDVAHNAEACAALADTLTRRRFHGRTLAVLGMLRDKPVEAVAQIMDGLVQAWYVCGLETSPRGLGADELTARMGSLSGSLQQHADPAAAFAAARGAAGAADRIVVFGSFLTVERIREMLHE